MNQEFRLRDGAYRRVYLGMLANALRLCDWTPLGYALMSSHSHLAMFAGNDLPGRFLQSLNGSFARWVNVHEGRLGPVWADRPRVLRFDGEELAVLLAYIHNNPVRAGIVKDPIDSTWTSHRAYVGEAPAPPYLNVELGLSLCGFDSSRRGRLSFHDFVVARSGLPRDPALSGRTLRRDRIVARTVAGAPVELGGPQVAVGAPAPRTTVMARPFTPLRPRWDGAATDVIVAAASAAGVSVDALHGRSRRAPVVRARRLALHCWVSHLGRRACEMAGALGISEAGASFLQRDIAPELDAEAGRIAEVLWASLR